MNKLGDAIAAHLQGAKKAQDAAASGAGGDDAKSAARRTFLQVRSAVIYPALCQAHDAVRRFAYRARCHVDYPGRYALDGELPAVLEIDRAPVKYPSTQMGSMLDCALVWSLEVEPTARVRVRWHGVPERQADGQDLIFLALDSLTAEEVSAQILEFVRVAARAKEA